LALGPLELEPLAVGREPWGSNEKKESTATSLSGLLIFFLQTSKCTANKHWPKPLALLYCLLLFALFPCVGSKVLGSIVFVFVCISVLLFFFDDNWSHVSLFVF